PFVTANGKKLVVIQLSGGNDGLNTIVPYRNDIYYKARPTLAIKQDKLLTLNDELGMNESMRGLKELFDQGWVGILNNVGYPNPDRSHFRSMDIWHSASDSKEYLDTGWIGRYLDATCAGCAKPISGIEIDDSLSLALKGQTVNGLALHDVNLFYKMMKDAEAFNNPKFSSDNDNLNYLYKTLAATSESADYLYAKSNIYHSKASYGNSGLAKDLKTIAELIISGVDTSVFYTSLSGFDTHVNQTGAQANHLKDLSEGLNTFMYDLKSNNRLDDVTVFVFSEFGRRVAQNASNGTDHGTANNVFIISSQLKKAGVLNETPDLQQLDYGDLMHSIDFRRVYATLINKCLGADDAKILGRKFELLGFL
ncbi:MAG: twin-arginine translocation pathway signal, partial [Bacteroidota bacterium]|nr:twin-arginine translocation pathway signal [Bacteroidota bacterium]